ncbi:YqcI/YcgG family protein [Pontibacillus salicampi]|uniref:YqcI/YcgG family protein n=1 Tax=Pontibacillus salicampi TaxID=1449801 RepID=A0ABV6LKH5_9BACI
MTHLLSKSMIEENPSQFTPWQHEAFTAFKNMIADKDNTYPCVPGRQGFLMDHLRYGFIGDPREEASYKSCAALLKEYTECSRDTGKYASIAFLFETPVDMIEGYDVEQYERLFWNVLNGISRYDEKEWPEDIPKDPHDHQWEFCFHGEPYFAFCATPAHTIRKSRHFTHFLIAFQPRWVFEEINDSTPFGRKMKKAIRERLFQYDGMPGHPSLKWYGQEDNYEWKQYFLRDDDSALSKCPYTRFKNLLSRK